ncbi:MAG: hypothetical protein IJ393_06110 [Clostridia bacterium]|nr:hypothetical protein [Clostridia bacterium]MBQ7831624.1 hypothetical protein [Clostridia bacterium]
MKKWLKKALVALSCVTLGTTLMFGFAACKDDEESSSGKKDSSTTACTHVWNEGTVQTAATCTTDGSMLYTCTKCSETKTEKIAGGHKYNTTVVEATCLSDGYTLNTCSVCGTTQKTNVTKAGDHNYQETVVAATCTTDGMTTYTCKGCGDSYRNVTARATGHNTDGCTWTTEEVQIAPCTYQGIETTKCKSCGESIVVVVSEYQKHANTHVTTMAATCTTVGTKMIECNDCGERITEEIAINPNAHDWQVSGTNNGLTSYSCQHIGCTETKTVFSAKTQTSATVPSSAIQDAGEVELQNAAIKMDEAVKNQLGSADVNLSVEEADVSGIIDNETANKLGNNPVYNFNMSNASGPIKNFNGELTVTVPYTLEYGMDPDEVSVYYINDEGKVTAMPATYSEVNGEGFATFTTNHFSYYTVIRLTAAERCAAYGHTYKTTVVDPACNQQGYTVKTCLVCKKVEPRTNFTPALSHNYSSAVVAATCTEMGYTVYTCSLCNDKYVSDYTAKVAHKYEDSVTAPTCTANGYTTHTCTVCNSSYTDSETDAKGHTYANGACSVCGRKDPNAATNNFYWNMVESLALVETYYLEVSGLNIEMVNTYSNGDKQNITYKMSLAQVQIGFDETGIVGKGEGTMVMTNEETGKSPSSDNASGVMKFVFRDGMIYAYTKATETMGAAYEQYMVVPQSYMFDMEEDEFPAFIQMMSGNVAEIGGLLSGFGAGENSRMNNVLKTVIEYCFTKTETENGYMFTLNADRALEMYNAIKNNTVDKLFDLVFGEGAFAATQSFLVASVDKTVAQFEADVKTELAAWGINIDTVYTFINKYAGMMGNMGGGSVGGNASSNSSMPSQGIQGGVKPMAANEAPEAFDIKATIAEMGNVKISEVLDEMLSEVVEEAIDYKAMINECAEQLKAMKIFDMAELSDGEIADIQATIEDVTKALRNNPVTFTTDKSGALLSFGAKLTDFVPVDNTGKTLGQDGVYTLYDVKINGEFKFVADGTYAGVYEDVVAKAEAAKKAYQFTEGFETDNYNVYVVDGKTYLWYFGGDSSDDYYYDEEWYLSDYDIENVYGTETYNGKTCTKARIRLTNLYMMRDSDVDFMASTDCHGWLISEGYWRGYYGYCDAWIDADGNVVGTENVLVQDWNQSRYFTLAYNAATGEYASGTQHCYKLVETKKGEGCAYTYEIYECTVCGARTAQYVDGGHNTQMYYELAPGSTSCEDGVYMYWKCVDCDRITSFHKEYYHNTYRHEYVIEDVSEECGDMVVVWYECACGAEKYIDHWQGNGSNMHYFNNSDRQYIVDEHTHRNYIETYTCSLELCQYKYTVECDWNYSYNGTEDGCQVWSTYTYRFFDKAGNVALTLVDNEGPYNRHYYDTYSSTEYSNKYGTGWETKWTCQHCGTVTSWSRNTYDEHGRQTYYEDVLGTYGWYREYDEYCTYMQYDLKTGEYETSGTNHNYQYVSGKDGDSCTQYYYEGRICSVCGDEDGYYRAPDEHWWANHDDGHNWYYNGDHYYCGHCGTESSTGSDAIISLEDMVEDGVLKVGYYNYREWRAVQGQDSLVLVDIVLNYDYNSTERITITADDLYTKVVTSPENEWKGDHCYEHNRESGIVTVNMDVLKACIAELGIEVENVAVIFSVEERTIVEGGEATWLEMALTFDASELAL